MKKMMFAIAFLAFGLLAVAQSPKKTPSHSVSKKTPTPSEPTWPLEPKDFHGIPFGSSEEDAEVILKQSSDSNLENWKCRTSGDDKICTYPMKIEDFSLQVSFTFSQNKMVCVDFCYNSIIFDYFKNIFIVKYGEPTSDCTVQEHKDSGADYIEYMKKHGELTPELKEKEETMFVTEGMNNALGRRGGVYINEKLAWSGPNLSLNLYKYGVDITESLVNFSVNSYRDKLEKGIEESKKKAIKDF